MLLHLLALLVVLIGLQLPRFVESIGHSAESVYARSRGFLDFDLGYYPASLVIRTNPSALYSGAGYDEAAGALRINAPANFVNIPLVAWLFVPFTLLSLQQAGFVLLFCNIALSLLALYLLLSETAESKARWVITLAFVTSGPLINALNMGQTSVLVLLLLVLVQTMFLRKQLGLAGALLGIVCLIKIPPVLLLLYFALRREWKVVGCALAVIVGAFTVSLLLYGWDLHHEYVNLVFRANAGMAIAAHNCQSMSSFLARTFTGASLLSWQPIEFPGFAKAILVVFQLLVAAGIVYRTLRSEKQDLALLAFITAGLLLLPVSWAHYGVWMLPVFAAAFEHSRWKVLAIIAMVLINIPVLPVSIVRQFEQAAWFRLAVSHMFFGLLIFQGILYLDHRKKV